jgi:hypothetical protein
MHENRETSGTSRPYPGRDRSEKAKCRNADRRVPEESDCTVVPMNPANNEEQSSAERGEGRVQAKENIVQSNTDPNPIERSRLRAGSRCPRDCAVCAK